jgi:DNA-binding CsgD family transcriptional regulator
MTDTYRVSSSGSLSPDDCRRIVSVLEDVIDTQSLAELGDRLPDALVRHLGWVDGFEAATLTVSPLGGGLDPHAEEIAKTLNALLARLLRSLSYEEPFDDWSFTAREGEIVRLVADGLTNRQIAARLGITPDTVKKHLTNALTKADCTNRTQLAIVWRRTQRVGATDDRPRYPCRSGHGRRSAPRDTGS